jgi:hypothetical protein
MWLLNSRKDCFQGLSKVEESKHQVHWCPRLEENGVVFYIFSDYGMICKLVFIIDGQERTRHYSPKDIGTRWQGTKQRQ